MGIGQKPNVHPFNRFKGGFSRRSAGFTTIELMVAVSIIILLLGIGFVASSKYIGEARKEQVRSSMTGLMGANEEFKAKRKGGSINHEGGNPMDWTGNDARRYSSTERFVKACRLYEASDKQVTAAMLSGQKEVNRRVFDDKDNDGIEEIYDVWETQLEYRLFNDGKGSGPVTNVSNELLPLSRSPFFVSAGPDKQFGTEDDITTVVKPTYKN